MISIEQALERILGHTDILEEEERLILDCLCTVFIIIHHRVSSI